MKIVKVFSRGIGLLALSMAILITAIGLIWSRNGKANASWALEGVAPWEATPSFVTVDQPKQGVFRYLVNGSPQLFIGMGYNPIYRYLSMEERAANYHRDFQVLCQARVNHIIGWDFDKGYEQDKFDKTTLDTAHQYGLGVLMPFYLPPDGDYRDEAFTQGLMDEAAEKIARFRRHPALRMWGVGNEVLSEMPRSMRPAFGRFYLRLADLFHELDPNHPVIYREAEDFFVPAISAVLQSHSTERPWLLYGMNIYSMELERTLDEWPEQGLQRPLFVTEFGAEPDWDGGREINYLSMWRMIRAHPEYVLGGAPYVWTIHGPEPTDLKWGLMDADGQPLDNTFEQLAEDWRREQGGNQKCAP